MKKILITISILVVLGATVFAVWQIRDERARAAQIEAEILKGLTAEELALILKSEAMADRSSIAAMQENADKRKAFISGMREYLALAAEARRAGLAEDENNRLNAEYKKRLLLTDLYTARQSQESGKVYTVTEEELVAVWTNPTSEERFKRDIEALQDTQRAAAAAAGKDTATIKDLDGDMLTKARKTWARTEIISARARADAEFINQPEIALRLKIVEAGILATDYLRTNWVKSIKATDQEIAAYLTAHPEFDVAKKRQKAEEILQKVKNGEDFTALAKDFSEDRPTKDKGGLYENIGRDFIWKEVEDAALGLEPGQVADQVIESRSGFHIVKLDSKKIGKNADGSEQVSFSVRHILLQNKFEEPGPGVPGIPPPFMTAEEIARAEVEKEKRTRFVAGIIERNPVSLPEDFTIELPDTNRPGS